jgi:hypothetical protein
MNRKLIMEFEVVETGGVECDGCYFDGSLKCPDANCDGVVFMMISERIEEDKG